MPKLKAAFEAAGFTDVRTVLSSGNVVFQRRGPGIRSDASAEGGGGNQGDDGP
jgi:hypothetical protein